MCPRRPSRSAPLLALLVASLLAACGDEKGTSNVKTVEKAIDPHPAWFVGRWVFDLEASERRLDALGVAKDAKPGEEGMTRGLLTAWDATGLEYDLGAGGELAQRAKRAAAPDERYRWKAVGPDEIEFGPKPGTDLASRGFRPQRLRRVGEGLESYNPRLPIHTKGGEFRYLYKRAPK